MDQSALLQSSLLNKTTVYPSQYDASLLFPIERQLQRDKINITAPLPFYGFDCWRAYEVSWLNKKGKPQMAIAEVIVPVTSERLIESKSFKLYLNSFNNSSFASQEQVLQTIKDDLSQASKSSVQVTLINMSQIKQLNLKGFDGILLDEIDCNIDVYEPDAALLQTSDNRVTQTLYSNLLRSNCPVTAQPDWGSVRVQYQGAQINAQSLLKYIVSFRNHQAFHEQCVERMFMDIMQQCKPQSLIVDARYTRRGGLDINPIRSSNDHLPVRLLRQPRQ